jgi:hypothetical protein
MLSMPLDGLNVEAVLHADLEIIEAAAGGILRQRPL